MPSSIFAERRTRSQVTLPDQLLFQLSQGSPLKDARTALRNSNHTYAEPLNDTRVESAEETDDELLLSPGKVPPTARTNKRSVSPPLQDQYTSQPDSPSKGRELKRLKRDEDGGTTRVGESSKDPITFAPRSLHSRSLSQPEPEKKPSRTRSGTTTGSGSSTPSTTKSNSNESAQAGKGRAQSVPLFPSSSSSAIVHIDLRNPPPSPHRARSRSPSKERELRIISGPPTIPRLDTISDEAEMGMNIDDDTTELSNAQMSLRSAVTDTLDNPDLNAISGDALAKAMSPQHPANASPTHVPSIPILYEPPSTPTSRQPIMTPLSPLTPLPETPHSSKCTTSTENRFAGTGWGTSLEEGEGEEVRSQPTHSSIPAAKQTQMGPPSVVPSATKTLVPGTSKPAIASDDAKDAFAMMMARSREAGDKGEAKGKGKATATKSGSSSKTTAKASSRPKTAQKVKTNGKGKEPEARPPKKTIKMLMKPKAEPKPKPVVVPVPSSSNESEAEDRPPSLRASSPANTPPHSRPASPPIMDVSMESIAHTTTVEDRPPDLPEDIPPTPPLTLNLTEAEPLLEITTESPRQAAQQPIATESTATQPTLREPAITKPAATKPTKTKLHISKRVPTTVAPANRVTRSVSSKRNQKAPEQTLAKKKSIPVIIPVISGSSSKTTDHTLQEDMGSKSSLSDLRTDPAEPALLPGSPMKLSSPAKATKETSMARLSSKAAKISLSKSPVKLKPAKSATPSPNKLTRSASMFSSRPTALFTGTLSRTFTFSGYGNKAGSSLSTLSSALEKLHRPPPGRPNTSMGFNRDYSDTSFELKTTSKDDTSVGPSGSSHSNEGTTSQAASETSRSVERTLISGPRSSITGNSIFGKGTMMRGTGGFKVPGNVLKPGVRTFGVGSGAFAGASRARTMQKASRKPGLPSVMASPVKGGDRGDAMNLGEDEASVPEAGSPTTASTEAPADQQVPLNDKGKGKERSREAWTSNASRRVSLASQALSQSLNAAPPKETTGLGLMGPPATPNSKGNRSASSTYPSSKASTSSGGEASDRVSPSTRSLTMSLRNAPSTSKVATTTASAATTRVSEVLKTLEDCVIFVDVRTDDGDEAGSLFVEMLEGVGARVLTRVGQTCTHIVFKNGLMSTLNRYRLLRDPKPLVVGIAWVVECVEQRKQVDETKFLIDLEGMNVSGTNKRRRSMLPKLISRSFDERGSSDVEGDVSMDGSTSSMTVDDDLTPLEKARRRKAITSTR
ncbi:hypothetical protein FPV67DRAFT_1412813 [Lyophyllum atratum]|nr:hypothetical protein FPV67DRAFT_1412813 [Lyophyllum atratum]